MIGVSIVGTLALVATYHRINAGREKRLKSEGEMELSENIKLESKRLGDRAVNFRYSL